jgi:hypothetical protein
MLTCCAKTISVTFYWDKKVERSKKNCPNLKLADLGKNVKLFAGLSIFFRCTSTLYLKF